MSAWRTSALSLAVLLVVALGGSLAWEWASEQPSPAGDQHALSLKRFDLLTKAAGNSRRRASAPCRKFSKTAPFSEEIRQAVC